MIKTPYFRLVILFLLLLSPIAMKIQWDVETELIAVIVAWMVGVGAIMQTLIQRWFFPPIFKISIKEVHTEAFTYNKTHPSAYATPVGKKPQKWYNLIIWNEGYSPAKNVRVKIRDEERKDWINLKRPFFEMREDKITINTLASGEEEAFNIGYIDSENNKFQVASNILPNNQKIELELNEKQNYLLEAVADNASPHPKKVEIINKGYKDMDASCIKIIDC